MATFEGGKYVLVLLVGSILIGATLGNPVPNQQIITNEIDQGGPETAVEVTVSSTTTEHPDNVVGKLFTPAPDRPGSIRYSGGVHQFRIGHDEDEQKRLLEEYYYHFERVEKNLPPTTRKSGFRPPERK